MTRKILLILCLATAPVCLGKGEVPPCGQPTGIDLAAAMQYCEQNPSDQIEGIWTYPDEGFICLIQSIDDNAYRMVALETEETAIETGTVLGYIYPTPEANIYDMYLYSTAKKGLPSSPRECVATLSQDGEGLSLAFKKYRFVANPLALLPWARRLLRMHVENPMDKMPRGMRKIAPSYDHNGSSKRKPRYL